MKAKKTSLLLLSSLDDIAYLLNLRGSDIIYNPVFFSYLLLAHNKVSFDGLRSFFWVSDVFVYRSTCF